jgi:hypothetical protein
MIYGIRRSHFLHRILDLTGELAVALEERGIESPWAPEHSHIPVSRRSPMPGGRELARRYYDVMDPFFIDRGCDRDKAPQGWYMAIAIGIALLPETSIARYHLILRRMWRCILTRAAWDHGPGRGPGE